MKCLEYRFECVHMKGGWCVKEDGPGCFYDCPLKSCRNCRNEKCPPHKEPCSKCWMNEKRRQG